MTLAELASLMNIYTHSYDNPVGVSLSLPLVLILNHDWTRIAYLDTRIHTYIYIYATPPISGLYQGYIRGLSEGYQRVIRVMRPASNHD